MFLLFDLIFFSCVWERLNIVFVFFRFCIFWERLRLFCFLIVFSWFGILIYVVFFLVNVDILFLGNIFLFGDEECFLFVGIEEYLKVLLIWIILFLEKVWKKDYGFSSFVRVMILSMSFDMISMVLWRL